MDKKSQAIEDKLEVKELQNFYVNSTISNLPELVEERQLLLLDQVNEYILNNNKKRYNKNGDLYYELKVNPIVINKYFFSSLSPLSGYQPKYSSESLSIVFNLYEEICSAVNEKIGNYLPTISNFCKFAGISTTTFSNYCDSTDLSMRILTDKVLDYCFDSSVTASQLGMAKESITKYRMKTELGKIEKETPTVHIHAENIVDMKDVTERLDNLISYNKKKVVEAEVIEQKEEEHE